MKRVALLAFTATVGVLFSTSAKASTIIDNVTPGFYNAGLGDLALDSVLGIQTDTSTGFHLFPAANVAGGDPLIPSVASEPNLSGADAATRAALGNFLSNTIILGGSWSAAPQAIPSAWRINSETAIVYEINAGLGLNNVSVMMGVDNGVFVWLNGAYRFGALAPGSAIPGEYSFSRGNLTGTNYLQILREDHGGITGFDILVSGEVVPEPQSLTMLGSGLLALAGLSIEARRRRWTSRSVVFRHIAGTDPNHTQVLLTAEHSPDLPGDLIEGRSPELLAEARAALHRSADSAPRQAE